MEQSIVLMIMALMLGASQPVMAQDSIIVTPLQQQGKAQPPSLDERFEDCINNDKCDMRERMRLMDDMSDDMHEAMRRMDLICSMMDYNECIGPQRDEREQWHEMHANMQEMMQSMETRALNKKESKKPAPDEKQETAEKMNKSEPSAGEEIGEEKRRFWWWPKFR